MVSPEFQDRDAISRARFFLNLADACSMQKRSDHEAFLEAAILFTRAALHRLTAKYKHCAGCKAWFNTYRDDDSVRFIKTERNQILKESPPKVGQVVYVGESPELAKYAYYYERGIPAIDTVRRHLKKIEEIVVEGEGRFRGGDA